MIKLGLMDQKLCIYYNEWHVFPQSKLLWWCIFTLQNYTSEASLKDKEIKKSNKWGYTREENGFKKHNKNTTGLYHLGTISLPEQLEKNLNSYLKSNVLWNKMHLFFY